MISLAGWHYRHKHGYNTSSGHWFKHFDTKHECQCNHKDGVQIIIWRYDLNGYTSYQVEITAEALTLGKNHGDWAKLSFYSLQEVEQRHIDALLVAWNAMNEVQE